MSLFSKIQIDPKLIPFIEKGQGVGVVKINEYGKASARLEESKLILESYEGKKPVIESIPAITFLSYDAGNFIVEPKFVIGVSSQQFVLAGVDNNDQELERFYNTLLNIKNNEKMNRSNSKRGMPHPNQQITNPHKAPQRNSYNAQAFSDRFKEKISNSSPAENESTNQANNKNIPESQIEEPIASPQDDIIEQPQDFNSPIVNNPIDPADEIRKYFQLKEDGIITEEEFNKKKKQLLGID